MLNEFYEKKIVDTLPSGVALDDVLTAIEIAIQQYRRDDDAEASIEGIKCDGEKLFLKWRRRTSTGRPQHNAIRAYILSIVGIYERGTGKQIRRKVVSQSHMGRQERREGRNRKEMPGEIPNPFILACIRALRLPKGPGTDYGTKTDYGYPSNIVKEILHEHHPQAKRGRPRGTIKKIF